LTDVSSSEKGDPFFDYIIRCYRSKVYLIAEVHIRSSTVGSEYLQLAESKLSEAELTLDKSYTTKTNWRVSHDEWDCTGDISGKLT